MTGCIKELLANLSLLKTNEVILTFDKNKLILDITSIETDANLITDMAVENEESFSFALPKYFNIILSVLNSLNGHLTLYTAKENRKSVTLVFENNDLCIEYILVVISKETKE